jgi:ParB-like nuclease domain
MAWRDQYKVHPAAEKFPRLSPEELQDLAEDIRANGLREPITVFVEPDGSVVVIDGINRLDAYDLIPEDQRPPLGDSDFVEISDESLEKYIISKNIYRRNLTKQQQVALIADILGMDLSNDRLSANRSFSPEPGERGGSTKDPLRATLVEEAAKIGIPEATVKTTISKARGTFKPRAPTKRAPFPKPEPDPIKSRLQELREKQQQPSTPPPVTVTNTTPEPPKSNPTPEPTAEDISPPSKVCPTCGGTGLVGSRSQWND